MKKTRLINKLNNSKINTSTNKTNNNPITKHLQTIQQNDTRAQFTVHNNETTGEV